VDGRRLAVALLRAARHHGAVVRDGEAALIATGGRVLGVWLGSERLEVDQGVVTAGAWAPALLRELGIDLPIRPQRGQIVHLRLVGRSTKHWPVILPLGASHYLLAFDDQRVVAGATRGNEAGSATA
jgi:D-amino-acid dehydrogenase